MEPSRNGNHSRAETRETLTVHRGSGAVEVGLEAVKFTFLLNGAGAVALLGLMTAESIQARPETMKGIASALTFLSIGAALAPLTLVFAFWAIHAQYQAVAKWNSGVKVAMWFWRSLILGSVAFGVTSVVLFIYSIWTLGPILASGS